MGLHFPTLSPCACLQSAALIGVKGRVEVICRLTLDSLGTFGLHDALRSSVCEQIPHPSSCLPPLPPSFFLPSSPPPPPPPPSSLSPFVCQPASQPSRRHRSCRCRTPSPLPPLCCYRYHCLLHLLLLSSSSSSSSSSLPPLFSTSIPLSFLPSHTRTHTYTLAGSCFTQADGATEREREREIAQKRKNESRTIPFVLRVHRSSGLLCGLFACRTIIFSVRGHRPLRLASRKSARSSCARVKCQGVCELTVTTQSPLSSCHRGPLKTHLLARVTARCLEPAPSDSDRSTPAAFCAIGEVESGSLILTLLTGARTHTHTHSHSRNLPTAKRIPSTWASDWSSNQCTLSTPITTPTISRPRRWPVVYAWERERLVSNSGLNNRGCQWSHWEADASVGSISPLVVGWSGQPSESTAGAPLFRQPQPHSSPRSRLPARPVRQGVSD
ncbi:uncharacterized protein LOC121696183 [Alosa sapidissima]|uniref:uncharacterized protein LOC121696183 n=1 Tax=Alosa sapidissima TaxID=34773 RepID=UPI001C093897|nr:uncharacterized protein LOC121696183 [Alosa sapidissima]